MPAYHSTLNELQTQEVCGCALLPIKTRSRGPAPPAPDNQDDIVDEIIQLFRANVMFTNFEIKGNADRVLIYGTLFVHLCLKKLDKCTTKADGELFTLVCSALWMLACGGDERMYVLTMCLVSFCCGMYMRMYSDPRAAADRCGRIRDSG